MKPEIKGHWFTGKLSVTAKICAKAIATLENNISKTNRAQHLRVLKSKNGAYIYSCLFKCPRYFQEEIDIQVLKLSNWSTGNSNNN